MTTDLHHRMRVAAQAMATASQQREIHPFSSLECMEWVLIREACRNEIRRIDRKITQHPTHQETQ